MKVLLVDNSNDRQVISECLQQSGFDFSVVENATDAWKLFQAPDSPALILIDWVLPGIEGIELCRQVVFSTAY